MPRHTKVQNMIKKIKISKPSKPKKPVRNSRATKNKEMTYGKSKKK